MNYIVLCNRATFETAWRPRDFLLLLCTAGFAATSTHLLLRLGLYGMSHDADYYASYRFASINFIVMALLVGLRQQARPSFEAVV